MKYVYRSGASVPGVSAEKAAEELERIRIECGELTPKALVDESRDENAVLHSGFEWDDAIAAEAHRMQQARQIIRGVCIVSDGSPAPVPMHFHITTKEGGRYESISRVENDPDLYEAALAELNGKLHAAQLAVDQLLVIGKKRIRGPKKKAAAASVKQHLEEAAEAMAVLT